jgi:hypothetical protein
MERDGVTSSVEGQGAGSGPPIVPSQITKTEKGSLELKWHKHPAGHWCLLDEVDLKTLGTRYGVFVIWRNGNAAKISAVLYVGRGRLESEIAECRRSPLFASSRLRVSWADVDRPSDLDGVATYLYQQLRPMWGEIMTSARPLPVNLPLSA